MINCSDVRFWWVKRKLKQYRWILSQQNGEIRVCVWGGGGGEEDNLILFLKEQRRIPVYDIV